MQRWQRQRNAANLDSQKPRVEARAHFSLRSNEGHRLMPLTHGPPQSGQPGSNQLQCRHAPVADAQVSAAVSWPPLPPAVQFFPFPPSPISLLFPSGLFAPQSIYIFFRFFRLMSQKRKSTKAHKSTRPNSRCHACT
jgi:hypothetical protein